MQQHCYFNFGSHGVGCSPAHGNTSISEKKRNSTVQCIESKSRLLDFDLVYQNLVGGGSQTLESHCIFGRFSSFQQPVAWGLSNT
jgi:hypothetical protein